jgi:hypothetical protein
VSPSSRRRSQPSGRDITGNAPDALFRELLHAARELLAVRSPLDAELMVSELLGTWWSQRHRVTGSVEQLVGEGLVSYAASNSSPASLALLSGIAALGTPRQAQLAEQAAIELIDSGVRAPAWASHVGAVAVGECYVNPDRFGDTDEIICVYSYAGEEPHALVMVVDYNSGALLRDGWVTSRVDKLLDHCRSTSSGFDSMEPSAARHLLEAALKTTDDDISPPVGESFASYHAFIRSRIRALPPSRGRGRRRTPTWSRERRALLAAEFLASDEAEDLSDRRAASYCADRIIDYGCDQDFGRPDRVSPMKVRSFLLGWLPRKVMLSVSDQEAMPHVLAAWVRWAGRRSGLDQAGVNETLEAVFDSMDEFGRAYRDLAEFGLDERLVARLLPDSDLEALPRRAFAFPVLEGFHGGVDLSALDPADPADRRMLLAADHDTRTGSVNAIGVGRHIERHLALADRLWRGSPSVLWDAAQRLLDTGEDRHLVMHALMDVMDAAGDDEEALEAALRDIACAELRRAVAAATGAPEHERIAGPEIHAVAARHLGDGAVRALHPVLTERAVPPARHAAGGHPPVPAERGHRHSFEET